MDRCLAQTSWQSLRESFRQLQAAGEVFEAFTQGRLDELARLAARLSQERAETERQRQELTVRQHELQKLERRDNSLVEQLTAETPRLNALLLTERTQLISMQKQLADARASLSESHAELEALRFSQTEQQNQALADQVALEGKLAATQEERDRLRNELTAAEKLSAEIAANAEAERQLMADERAKQAAELQLLEEALDLHAQAAAVLGSVDALHATSDKKAARSVRKASKPGASRPDPVLNGLIAQLKQLQDTNTRQD